MYTFRQIAMAFLNFKPRIVDIISVIDFYFKKLFRLRFEKIRRIDRFTVLQPPRPTIQVSPKKKKKIVRDWTNPIRRDGGVCHRYARIIYRRCLAGRRVHQSATVPSTSLPLKESLHPPLIKLNISFRWLFLSASIDLLIIRILNAN